MELDAGHGAALGGALPAELPLTRRLRSLLSWPLTDDDPVSLLVRTHRAIHPGTDPNLLRRAYTIADNMHRGQFRKSGDPYITHPLAVAQICAELGMDHTTLVAALLHDTVEDTCYTLQALDDDFGPEVAHLVDGVTKFDKAFYGKSAEAETIRKMIVAAGKDVRVLIIKLADRLHNMRTLDARSASSRARIAKATHDVLVPLCDRLGIQVLKRELDDVVLMHLEPEEHARIDRHISHGRPHWAPYLDRVVNEARVALRRDKVDAKVDPRPRHYYSIWKDTIAGDHVVPFDLPRIAVVVDGTDTDCYAALGSIHGLWRPVPGRFKDFIASPKNNLYRSLHTTVTGPEDRTVEVLIRTRGMHQVAEYGVVADYRFPKAAGATGPSGERLDWLRRVLDWEQETSDPAQFLDSLRCDLAEAQIQVFTEGRQVVLPAGSTPVDLAYELGNARGDHCLAAKINGRLVPLSSALEEGDVVEIISETESHTDYDANAAPPGPRKEWLGFVKSPHAQLQINRFFADHQEPGISIADKVRLGRAAIGLTLRKHNRGLASDLPLRRLSEEQGYPDLETMLVAVFDRKVSPDTVVEQLIAMVDHPQ
ncbi:RelA/SpoT family protein [Micromonospora zhanjiangensis]|uniref:RelA/SpoT family protein n=1 Tax=Micromonospora zhanjiangensis TaxID=1522057 RepID=A0ABV8KHW9_9ACTN